MKLNLFYLFLNIFFDLGNGFYNLPVHLYSKNINNFPVKIIEPIQ